MAGPTSDYGYTSFGSDVTTPGYVSESATGAQCDTAGTCTYTFQHAIPADAKGSFAIGIESRRTETLLPGTTNQMDVRYGAANKVFYFSVDGSPVQPRRTVVQTASCNQCHCFLSFHGDNRNQVEMCVLCHNPSLTATPDDPNQLATGVNFNLLIHRIHSAYKYYADVRYPAMSPQGGPGDTRNCAMCHVNDSQTTPAGIRDVLDPQGFINPVKPITSSCIGCHVTAAASSHALANTTLDRRELRGLSWPGLQHSRSTSRMRSIRTTVALLVLGIAAVPTEAQQAEYVGSETCQACHEDIHAAFQKDPHAVVDVDKKRGRATQACESCHGPASKHVESASADDIRNPAKLGAAKPMRAALPAT